MRGRGMCVAGGMCGGGCAWQGAFVARVACMARGFIVGGVHGTHAPPCEQND